MKKYKLALFIGRFQPFHLGHLHSLKKAVEVGERVMVGVGSSQESGTESNPWNYEKREEMVEVVIAGESILRGDSLKVKIVGIPDYKLDSEWAREVVRVVREIGYDPGDVVVVGNNNWTNRVLREAGMAVLESGLYQRDELEGVKIRKSMRERNEEWRERMPECVSEKIDLCVLG